MTTATIPTEVYKILEANGSIIIGFIDKNSQMGKMYKKRKKKSLFYKNATFYSVKDVIHHLKRIGFRSFNFFQTIFRDITTINNLEPIKEGYGEGSFVVIKAIK